MLLCCGIRTLIVTVVPSDKCTLSSSSIYSHCYISQLREDSLENPAHASLQTDVCFQELKRYFVWEQEDKSRAKNQFLPSLEFSYAWEWSNELWTLFSLSADGDRAWKDGLTYKRLSLLGFQEFSSRGVKCLYSAFVDMINCLQKLHLNTNFINKNKLLQGLIWVSSFDFIL